MKLALLTCTRDRPDCVRLLQHWLSRQTDSEFTHVVVDDGSPPLPASTGDLYLRRTPQKSDPGHTLGRNILHALPELQDFDALAFAEDDEYLTPEYVARIKAMLSKGDLVGEQHAKYYHVRGRRWIFFGEHVHCSLCRTAVSRDAFDFLERCIPGDESIDLRLWSTFQGRRFVHPGTMGSAYLTVSPKGMPGLRGKSSYHTTRSDRWTRDAHECVLKTWFGDDANTYRMLAQCHSSIPPSPMDTIVSGRC